MFDSKTEMTPATFFALNGGLILLTIIAGFLSAGGYSVLLVLLGALAIGVLSNGLMLVKALLRAEQGLGIAYGLTAAICMLLLWLLLQFPFGKPNGG